MKQNIRDDLVLAAYAVAGLGYTIQNDPGMAHPPRFIAGIPQNGLQFVKGDVHIWSTSRGWRVARLVDGLYPKAQDSEFYSNLLPALEDGAELAAEVRKP